jgi:hypothetical protein
MLSSVLSRAATVSTVSTSFTTDDVVGAAVGGTIVVADSAVSIAATEAAAVGRTVGVTGFGVSVAATEAAAEVQLAKTNAGNSSNAIHHMYLFNFTTLPLASISLFLQPPHSLSVIHFLSRQRPPSMQT